MYSAAIAAGDFNGDHREDLAVVNSNSNTVSILLNSGVDGFAPAVNYSISDSPQAVTIGDFKTDLVVGANPGFDVLFNVTK